MSEEITRVSSKSMDIEQADMEKLKSVFPQCFSEGKLDIDKLLNLCGEYIDNDFEKYKFEWKGKSDCYKIAGQMSLGTLRPCVEESVNFDNTNNIYIEGDNLEVLKLLQTSYYGKIKMIYIDPPYNTGNDFVYEDDFKDPLERYKEVTSQTTKSNPETMGRFHTNWLNMMFPRLRLAANLLRDDGVIFISIDDNEVDNLKKLCNEVFGEENFIAQLIWERAYSPKNDAKYISNSHDYVLMYAKKLEDFKIGRLPRTEEANARYSNPDNDPRGDWKSTDMSVKTFSESGNYPITTPTGNVVYPPAGRCWSLSRSTFEEKLKDNRISFGANGDGAPRIKTFLSELKYDGMSPTSILFYKDVGHSQEGRQELKKLFDDKGYFDGPKPIRLLNRLLTLANVQNDDIILDFFSGSATTAHAVMQLNAEDGGNRKFICVQLPEKCDEKSEAFKAGYKNICEIGKERIRRAGKKILGNCNNQSVCNVEVNSPPLEGCRDSGGVVRNTRNYMELPYNPTLKEKSRELRKAGNLSEVLLWQQIKNKQFNNLDFDRQKIIGNYIVDFYCASKNIVIEIDGISHDEKQKYDETRDNYLKSLGLEVIHILDIDVYKNLDGVIKNLNNHPALTSTPPKEGNPVTPDSINHKTTLDIGFKVFKLDTSNLAKWDSTPIENNDEKVLFQRFSVLRHSVKQDRSELDVVYEVMLKLGVPLEYELTEIQINDKKAYSIGGENCIVLVCLDYGQDGITIEDIEKMCEYLPVKIVAANEAFKTSSVLTNAHYILKNKNIELNLL